MSKHYWVLDQRGNKAMERVEADNAQQAIANCFNHNQVKQASCMAFDFATQCSNSNSYQYWQLVKK